jgi:hypothetical protein
MNVVKVATLHANVGYGLVLGVWVVEGAAAEAQGAAVAVAQDIVGAQAMVEGIPSVLKYSLHSKLIEVLKLS